MGLRFLHFVVTRSDQSAGFKIDRVLIIKKPKSDAVVAMDTCRGQLRHKAKDAVTKKSPKGLIPVVLF